jgi:hypothetical protein
LLAQNSWLIRKSLWQRLALWLVASVTWPGLLFALFAALAGWRWTLAWLVTSLTSAVLYAVLLLMPGRAASLGARQLMRQDKEERLRNLPPRHPNRSL